MRLILPGYQIRQRARDNFAKRSFSMAVLAEDLRRIGTYLLSSRSKECFVDNFGVTPELGEYILYRLPVRLHPFDYLLAMHFAKTYPTEQAAAPVFRMCPRTYHGILTDALPKLNLLPQQV